ncbi:competence protein ComEC [Echinicola strongylocentroti]|uniref:Competence protein ComEC n=1 Tax=Echinicola strongylocentroti TaxID=1795355 RepID=A0A2Z4IGK9_9BACT|nr:ComEC/Rec2 family competence protein [Echinicola strongylocentroti]AWW30114.1 competence protein ComEC [Echinicola strongylocentroti]
MQFNEFPFLRYVLFFMAGIVGYSVIGSMLSSMSLWAVIVVVLLIYLGFAIVNGKNKRYRFRAVFPVLAYLLLVIGGYTFASRKDVTTHDDHLLHLGEVQGYMGEVLSLDEAKPSTYANELAVRYVQTDVGYQKASGKVLIYHRLDDALQPGDMVWVAGTPQRIAPPKNPKAFDYRRFMARKQVYHQHFIGDKVLRLGEVDKLSLYEPVLLARKKLGRHLEGTFEDSHALEVGKALLLGQKADLGEAVSEAYITAGAMHVLAVSGLHVGMIYGFFLLFFKPSQLSRMKRVVYLTMVVLLIWMYSMLTGMSPSVMRAATMFTVLSLAQMQSRSPSVFNTLAISALLLMLFNPFIIFEVGFQLSYAAMFGILILQPAIVSIWLPRNKVLYYLWEITSVSIAAQLATFPLSAYYFHVFPNYFLLSNLWVIPNAFLVMAVGLPFMLLSLAGWTWGPLGWLLEQLLKVMNSGVFLFDTLPYAQTDGITLKVTTVFLLWGLMACLYLVLVRRIKAFAYGAVLVIIGLIAGSWWSYFGRDHQEQLYVYSLREGVAMDYHSRDFAGSFQQFVSEKDLDYQVVPHRMAHQPSAFLPMAFAGQENEFLVFLPNGHVMKARNGGVRLMENTTVSAAFYDGDKWVKMNETSEFYTKKGAVRLIFE